ncbi:NadR type nicotinamide-nucleotide adenylyltransferase [Actinoplanes lutulentus]|uniref:NadR type nicotinamide-nucleotide adenylyltransferase n=1 Tax=Actinoplanes lutulentus TaxID=1287878 RepID=A0A327Z7K6_9ACTN|nr:AAA family ATPase [Actinoplanes lutulentus]MBB2945156.1 NadR type nicotinamide-nucleotide adenylyltransferase [Actinoplanes lutulentus]RAK31952.1 NadR type nicotinamide-nucleotide adenylyltransferase [Actinoplanes lutulentus]
MRYRHGLIVGKFYPPHAGHHALIEAAAAVCDRVTVVVAPSSGESIPLSLRLDWLREAHGPAVRFAGVYDDHPIDYADPAVWDLHMALFRAAAGTDRVDAVFSSEEYGSELARRFHAEAVLVDPERVRVPVSGTAIREDPVAYWDRIGPGVRGWLTRRVIVVGAESTGTTTMARAMARHYRSRGGVWSDTRWVPEYGRELTEIKLRELRRDRPAATVFDVTWDRADFVTVAAEQNAAEDAAARAGSPVIFGDTDAFATTIWEERYLGSTSAAVAALVREPDLYLLTEADGVPFDDDGLRDGEHLRHWMTERFRTELESRGVAYISLAGSYPQRLRTAVLAVDGLLAGGWDLNAPITPKAAVSRVEQ